MVTFKTFTLQFVSNYFYNIACELKQLCYFQNLSNASHDIIISKSISFSCRVKGTEGLRVVDASVFPTQISGNTNYPVIMVAEKASDIIRNRKSLEPITHL